MTPTEQQILDHLEGRNDRALQTEPVSNIEWWLIEAVELLLRHQIELRKNLREEEIEKLTKGLCKEITEEVMAVIDGYLADKIILRNQGILR